jgi:hypothetical protein
MATLAQGMLHDALESFISRDIAAAQRVLERNDTLDESKIEAFRELLACMLHDSRTIEALNLVLVSRHLERIGDHATNIAEDVIFIVAARDVRHAEVARELTPSLTLSQPDLRSSARLKLLRLHHEASRGVADERERKASDQRQVHLWERVQHPHVFRIHDERPADPISKRAVRGQHANVVSPALIPCRGLKKLSRWPASALFPAPHGRGVSGK